MRFGTEQLFAVFGLLVSLPGGWGETKHLTGRTGGKLKLETGPFDLHGDFQIQWSHRLRGQTEDRTLINCGNDTVDCAPPDGLKDKLTLNTKSGALTLEKLSPGDSGLFVGFIIEANNIGHHYIYNVTVQEPDPDHPTENHRNHIAAFASLGLFGAVISVLLVALLLRVKAKTLKKKTDNIQPKNNIV